MCSAFVVQKRQFNELSFISGAKEDRTPDPLLAKQVLSQLSYTPKSIKQLVGLNGFEPTTSPLSGVRSNQLSYRPISSTA